MVARFTALEVLPSPEMEDDTTTGYIQRLFFNTRIEQKGTENTCSNGSTGISLASNSCYPAPREKIHNQTREEVLKAFRGQD